MHFAPSEEQRELAAAVRDMLVKECPPDVARAGDVDRVWPKLAEIGVLGLTVPESRGGLGFGLVEAVGVLEEAGRVALPGPLPETYAALTVADDDWVGRIASGEVQVTAAAPFAAYADTADAIVVGDKVTADLDVTPVQSVDPARPLFAVDDAAASGAAYDVGALAVAAYLVGVARSMVEQSVAYALTREQFGVPIGSFQAVKHRLADAHLGVEFARPVVQAAAWALDHDASTAQRDVSHAKVRATRAAQHVAKAALQVHGAIGYTEECDLVVWLRRTWSLATAFGDERAHRDRIAASMERPT
jgi:alkylation response protein AidB-like acyl-CoA dehydrogenase